MSFVLWEEKQRRKIEYGLYFSILNTHVCGCRVSAVNPVGEAFSLPLAINDIT